MTQYDIIRMAREAEGEQRPNGWWAMHIEDLERFAALVAAAEREACAQVCDNYDNAAPLRVSLECAAAIRARGTNAA